MVAGGLSNQRLNRLKEALIAAGVVRGERDKTVAAITGYAEGSTRRLLAGSTPLTGRFVKTVCIKFNIRWQWIEGGEEPMIARTGESPYPGVEYSEHAPQIAGGGLPESKPQLLGQPIASGINVPRIAGRRNSEIESELLNEIIDKIKQYYAVCGKERYLGLSAAAVFLHVISLLDSEIIDLFYQLRRLRDGDSDRIAVIAANEKFEYHGVKPTTRLKLERIPVESPAGEEGQ